jgi:hypothetical protein
VDGDLVRLNLGLEYRIGSDDTLSPLRGEAWVDIPILYAARTASAAGLFLDARIPESARQRLRAEGAESFLRDPKGATEVLRDLPGVRVPRTTTRFVGAVFDRVPELSEFRDARWRGEDRFEIVDASGAPAAVAWSVRANALAAEVAVETAVPHRRRGFARQVTAAWAAHVVRTHRFAFYSYREENEPSARLAGRLGTRVYANGIAYS